MPKYRKKPVVIEAVRWTGENWPEVYDFAYSGDRATHHAWNLNDTVEIDTLEGTMMASKGDWIIRGVKGEYYPCKPDIFDLTYEACDADAS